MVGNYQWLIVIGRPHIITILVAVVLEPCLVTVVVIMRFSIFAIIIWGHMCITTRTQ
jgi:hypothetical protein